MKINLHFYEILKLIKALAQGSIKTPNIKHVKIFKNTC